MLQNIKRSKTQTARTPMRDRIAEYMHAGWTDYRDGKGFDARYDTWSQHNQNNYETGRRFAALVSAGGAIPKWARNQLMPVKFVPPSCLPAWRAEDKFFRDTSAIAA